MIHWLDFFWRGAALGLSATGAPGPLQAFLISESLAGGWRRGALVALAPLLTDIPIAGLMIFVVGKMPASTLRLISLVGGLFLWYLAWQLWGEWRKNEPITPTAPATGGIRKAMLMNFISPGPYLFWGLVTGPLLIEAWQQSWGHALTFLASFYGVFIGGMLLLVGVFHQARRLGEQVVRWLMLASVILLFVFGVLLFWSGVSG